MISRTYSQVLFWQVLFWLFFAGVLLLSLLPISGVQTIAHGDKINHALAYATLYFFAVRAFSHRCPLWLLAIALVLFGLAIEFAQSLTGYRFGDPWDLLANISGILVIWIAFNLRRR